MFRTVPRRITFAMSVLVASLVLSASACAPATTSAGMRVDPNTITYEEIQSLDVASLYEVVQRLRPRWFQDRAVRSTHGNVEVRIFQNETFIGTAEILRTLPRDAARSLTYLDATRAQSLPGGGSGHVAGAIVIHTR